MRRTTRVAIILLAAYCTACGTSYSQVPTSTNATSYGNTTNAGNVASLLGSTTSTTTTTTGTNALITERVGTIGYNSTTMTVSAGKVLKLIFTPGIQDQTIAGSGVSPQYSQLGVYITVGSVTQNTGMLPNGLYETAQSSPVLDFSSALSGAAATNAAYRQSYTITISRPNDDYWCLNYGEYCPWSYVYSTHPWHGTLSIQTDDTVAVVAN